MNAREIVRRLNRKFGTGTFRSRKQRCGWPEKKGAPIVEVSEGCNGWAFVAYADDLRGLGQEIREMRQDGFLEITR